MGLRRTAVAAATGNTNSADFENATEKQARHILNNLGITGNVTIECWIRLESNPTINDYSICEIGRAATGLTYNLQYAINGANFDLKATRGKHGVGNDIATYASANIGTGNWLHIACTYDGTNLKLFTAPAAGTHTERASVAASGNGNVNNAPDVFALAVRDPDDNSTFDTDIAVDSFWDGLIDDVRVWSIARTATNMNGDFEDELVGNEASLVAYYKLNNNADDTTANAFHLNVTTGSPTYSTTVPFAS